MTAPDPAVVRAHAHAERELGLLLHRISALGGTVYVYGDLASVDIYWDDEDGA